MRPTTTLALLAGGGVLGYLGYKAATSSSKKETGAGDLDTPVTAPAKVLTADERAAVVPFLTNYVMTPASSGSDTAKIVVATRIQGTAIASAVKGEQTAAYYAASAAKAGWVILVPAEIPEAVFTDQKPDVIKFALAKASDVDKIGAQGYLVYLTPEDVAKLPV